MFAIFKKELRSYFLNAIGYVYVGVFLAVSALICCYTTLGMQSYDTSLYFTYIIFSFIVLIPLLTMKLFSEEKKLRTEQLLMTAPVSIFSMVFGKFLAAFTLFVSSVLVSCINFFPLYTYANAEGLNDAYATAVGPVGISIFCCTIGIICIGMAFIAIGLFVSSLTENQLAAAIITVAIIVAMLVLNLVNEFIDNYVIRFIINWVCFVSRFSTFVSGMLDPSALLYYISITAVFLLLTVRVYDKRRWG